MTPSDQGDPLNDLLGSLRASRRSAAEPAPAADTRPAAETVMLVAVDPATRRGWARALALSLGALALAGFVTDAMAAGQLLDDAGPEWLAVVWPLGGIGLLAGTAIQARYVDRFARLPMLRTLCLGYAAAFIAVGVLFATSAPVAPAAALAWLLADQVNFLLPLVLWALAGDVFTAGQAVSTFPWISRLLFAGQIAGMAIAAAAPWVFDGPDLSLAWLLVIPVVVCIGVAIALPRALAGATTGAGHGRAESTRRSIADTVEFVRDLPSFRFLLLASFAALAAGVILEYSFLDIIASRIDGAGDVETFYAGTALAGFVACWIVQVTVTPRVLRRWGVAPALGVLPVVTTIAAAVMIVAGIADAAPTAAAAVLLWRLPRWSLDASARQAALATLPDERRARVSLLTDLFPFAVALLLVPIPILVGRLVGGYWAPAVISIALAAVAIVIVRGVARHWDATMLSWRLKRRRRLG
jgi:AAA family ATP:ADP antiporter